jgi:hypothetical protein
MAYIGDIIPKWGTFIYCLIREEVSPKKISEIQDDLLLNANFTRFSKEELLEFVREYLSEQLDLNTFIYIMNKIERDEFREDIKL